MRKLLPRGRTMSRNGFSSKKRRWPKGAHDMALRRYLLGAAADYKAAIKRRDGSQGAASPVRRIDPATGEVIGIVPARK